MLTSMVRWFDRAVRRRQFNIWLGLCSLGLILTFAACSSNPLGNGNPVAAVPDRIRIGYQVIPNAELLVKAMGLAEKAFPNTTIEWKQFDSGRDVNTAMAANSLDLGLVGSTGTSIGISNQLPYQVYFIHDVIGENEALVVRKDANIKSMDDLVGKKIAAPFGSTTHFSLLSALEAEKMRSTKLTILDMQPPDMLAAWQRGDIDGGFVWQPTLGKLVEQDGTILTSAKDLAKQGIITADVGLAHRSFIQKYPEALQTYISLLDEAVQLYREKPQEAAQTIAAELELSPQESLQMMNELVWLNSAEQSSADYLGTKTKPGKFAIVLQKSANFMKDQGSIPQVPELEKFRAAIHHR